jgi:predicted outer membrane repeat protein
MLFLFTLLCAAVASWQSVYAATITVTNTNDDGPGSLRQTLAIAQDGDTIQFSVTGTIILTSGPLSVPESKVINISGPGANALVINGNATTSLFRLFGTVSISDLTLTNGRSNGDHGGAIKMYPGSKLTLTKCIISNNSAFFNGGAIWLDAHTNSCGLETNLTLYYCTVTGNSAERDGGAIYSTAEGDFLPGVCGRTTVTINNCTISGNSANRDGGGFYNDAGDTRSVGFARLNVNNSTVSGNSASGTGGAITNGRVTRRYPGRTELTVGNSTISGNSASLGGGISNRGYGTVRIGDTVLKAGSLGQNLNDPNRRMTSLGYNLSSDDGSGLLRGPGDQINTDPMLGPLQNNGGPTLTHALLPGSPAIDHGNPIFRPPPDEDQRGCPFGRVFNNRIDVGSFESQPMSPPCPTPRPRPTPPPR